MGEKCVSLSQGQATETSKCTRGPQREAELVSAAGGRAFSGTCSELDAPEGTHASSRTGDRTWAPGDGGGGAAVSRVAASAAGSHPPANRDTSPARSGGTGLSLWPAASPSHS